MITRVHCVRRLYLKIDMHFETTDSYEDHSSLDQCLQPIQHMAKLDGILNKYVKPGTAAQALQDAPFLVKTKMVFWFPMSASIMCPCLDHSLSTYHRRQCTVLNTSGKLNFESESPHFDADSVCWTVFMTKLLTAVSVMQHVEKGKVGLDDDLRKVILRLSNIEVLKGFDDDGKPIMEKDRKPITLRESSRAYLVIS